MSWTCCGREDVFVALVEFGSDVADRRPVREAGAAPASPPRSSARTGCSAPLPGRSASQHFFTDGGRAFCLFTVLGSHARRMALVPRAASWSAGSHITDRATLAGEGGMP